MKTLLHRIREWGRFKEKTAAAHVTKNATMGFGGCRCYRCQNVFYFEHGDIALPDYCAFCGARFLTKVHLSPESFDSLAAKSN